MSDKNISGLTLAFSRDRQSSGSGRGGVDNGGEPPDDGKMEARVEQLEKDVSAIKIDVAVIRSKMDEFPLIFATKSDLHREINAQTWKLVTFVCGFGTALAGAVYFIATHAK